MSTFKSISQLPEHPGPINGNETLIISNVDTVTDELISQKYNLSSLKDEVADHVSATVSADLEEFKDQTSADISTFIDTHIHPLRRIIGLSTLDYYTYIGDDITEISNNIADYPELSSISNDVIWFDTTGDERFDDTVDTYNKIDNLQAQIYRLGLQYRDMHNILQYGAIPGTVYNNAKDTMIKLSEILTPPQDIESTDLLDIYIYGNYICKNKQLYYMMFNPSGFKPDATNFKWIFDEHDAGIENQKTISTTIDDTNYALQAKLINKDLSGYQVQMTLQAAIYKDSVSDPIIFSDNQISIDAVINRLSTNDMHETSFYISSDYYDSEYYKDNIKSEYYYIVFDLGQTDKISSDIDIIGNDYIDINNSDLYYCIVDDKHEQFPLNINVNWYFLSSYFDDDDNNYKTVKSAKYIRVITNEDGSINQGEVIYKICAPTSGTPICQVSTIVSSYPSYNLSLNDIKHVSAELFVESINNAELSTSKIIKGIGGQQPISSLAEPTIKAVCAKYDTTFNISEKLQTLYPGELVFLSDTDKLAVYNGKKLIITGSSSTESSGEGLTKSEIQNVGLDYLTFNSDPSNQNYGQKKLAITSDGKINIIQKTKIPTEYNFDNASKAKVWVSGLLQIGKIYCGGKGLTINDVISGNRIHPSSIVSHNFIELVNASNQDYELDNVYILYHTTDDAYPRNTSGHAWEFLKLHGKIKAGGTYLIRGAMCNPCNNNIININDCDIEWRRRTSNDTDIFNNFNGEFSRTGSLIEFSEYGGSFFLYYCPSSYNSTLKSLVCDEKQPNNLCNTEGDNIGYIDLVAIGDKYNNNDKSASQAQTGYTIVNSQSFINKILMKWFYMEPATQGNKDKSSRKESSVMTHIDLEKQQVIYKNGTRNQYYYTDDQKLKHKPNASFISNNKGFFTNKTNFDKNKPNIINITFGIQATEKTNGTKASRCFNWVSIGYYDEYVEIRKCNESNVDDDHYEWKKYYSITSKDNDDFIECKGIEGKEYNFHNFYDRIRWSTPDGIYVTTHKVIAKHKFTSGTYEYRIRRDYDDTYMSDIKTFTVYNDSEVESFQFIQTSDQQGFNWIEYQAWKSACDAICNNENDFKFTINTGDIAQSGNRVNEWLDYYDGRKSMDNKEEMFTIGNNDLCGSPTHILGNGADNTSKFNLINIQYYYTFELDCDNPPIAEYNDNKYPIYSLYSFNYGAFHFISLVSEIRSHYGYAFNTTINSTEHESFASNMNAAVERWLVNDLELYKNSTSLADCSKCIVFMHEMPFTIVTRDFFDINGSINKINSTTGRSSNTTGCKLNLENAHGAYRFSRIFKKEGIRLIMGGHKHTFSLSNPLYDAPEECIIPDNNKDYYSSDKTDPFISGNVDVKLSRKPVIEMPFDGVLFAISSTISSNSELSDQTELMNYVNTLSSYIDNTHKTQFCSTLDNIITYNDITKNIFADINLSSNLSNFLRINYVEKITAPTYIMSQATGYKLVSNKELPAPALTAESDPTRYTPWLLSYPAAKFSQGKVAENYVQHRPTYVTYNLNTQGISACIKQVDGIYYIDENGKASQYTLYSQNRQLSCCSLTFGKWGNTQQFEQKNNQRFNYFKPSTNSLYNKIYSNYIYDDIYIIRF